MNARERAAVYYLTPPVYSFWSWSDDGEALVWRDGKTIAFRAELAAVFPRLEKQPLPPLGAILLLLAAARDSWNDGVSEMGILSGLLELLSGLGPCVNALAKLYEPTGLLALKVL